MKFVTAEEIFQQAGSREGLPAWTYNSDELTQLEIEQLFLRNWMFVAHVSDLPRAGDYQCFEMGNERAVVVRDQDDGIRAFHNVCRHRASRVVGEDKGHCGKAFICPFHGWSYNLDGSIKNIPRANSFGDDFDKSNFGLKALDYAAWCAELDASVAITEHSRTPRRQPGPSRLPQSRLWAAMRRS